MRWIVGRGEKLREILDDDDDSDDDYDERLFIAHGLHHS